MEYCEVLRGLARKYLNAEGQLNVDDLIDDDDQEMASICLLGAIDGLWEHKEISDEEAAEALAKLNLSAEKKAKVRSNSDHVGDFN